MPTYISNPYVYIACNYVQPRQVDKSAEQKPPALESSATSASQQPLPATSDDGGECMGRASWIIYSTNSSLSQPVHTKNVTHYSCIEWALSRSWCYAEWCCFDFL